VIVLDTHVWIWWVQSYFQALQRAPDDHGVLRDLFLAGRYVDRFEKRGDEWRIAARRVVYDWVRPLGIATGRDAEGSSVRRPSGQRYPDDPYYALLASLPA
jgi:hypothetical protein